MSRKRTYLRLAAVLPALAFPLALAAPAASAAPDNDPVPVDANDIAAGLSGVLSSVVEVACTDSNANIIICHVNPDNTPFDGSN